MPSAPGRTGGRPLHRGQEATQPFANLDQREGIKRGQVVPQPIATAASVSGLTTVASIAALASLAVPADSAAYLIEGNRSGLFEFVADDLSAIVAVDTENGIYVAPDSDPTGATGAWVRYFTGLADQRWWGAIGDGVTDNYTALQTSINTAEALKVSGTQYGYGRGSFGLLLPAAQSEYYCSQKLVVDHTLYWRFENGFGPAGSCAALRYPANQGGILLDTGSTGSILDYPFLVGGFSFPSTAEGEYHGIEFRRTCEINGAKVFHFQGDGLFCNTNGTGYNVNGSAIRSPFCQGNRDGLNFRGEDANAMYVENPTTILNRRYGRNQYLTLGSVLVGGNSQTNGVFPVDGVNIPYTMCCNSAATHRYYLLPGGNGANPPSGTTANTADWAFFGLGGTAGEFPIHNPALLFRSGGAGRFEGSYEHNGAVSIYYEPDQAPYVVQSSCQMLFITAISGVVRDFTGEVYGGQLWANGAGLQILRGLRIGGAEYGVPLSFSHLNVDGDIYLNRTGVDYSPTVFLDATGVGQGCYVRFWHNGGGDTLFLGLNGDLYYQTDTSGDIHTFNCGPGNTKAIISNSGLAVTGSLTATNLSGTNTGDQFTAVTSSRLLGRYTAGFGAAEEIALSGLAVTGGTLRVTFSATSRILARKSGGAGDAEEATTSEVLDFLGSTRGSVLYRGASGWAILAPGTSGFFLKSNGAGADPSYAAVSASTIIRTATNTAGAVVTGADADGTILCNATGGAITAALPVAASSANLRVTLKKIDSSANAVTLDGNAAETIDGATTFALSSQWDAVTVHCDGAAWYIV
jgi:hypothetical protein